MPTYILKVDPEPDLYCLWSTVVEAPTFVGTRAEVTDHLRRRGLQVETDDLDGRFDRADSTGTSSFHGDGGWGDDLIVEQRGVLPRSQLRAFLNRLDDDDESAYALLEPFPQDGCRPMQGSTP